MKKILISNYYHCETSFFRKLFETYTNAVKEKFLNSTNISNNKPIKNNTYILNLFFSSNLTNLISARHFRQDEYKGIIF